MTFTHWGIEYGYHDAEYNDTRKNERAVELPIALGFADRFAEGLEVGNVLGHYGVNGHRVVDRYEHESSVDNTDVFDISGKYEWIVAISTLEHVRWDPPEPREPQAALRALRHLESLLLPGGRMLVTIPMGHHSWLDPVLMAGHSGATRECTMVRDGDGWRQTDVLQWEPYGLTTIWAESVWIGEWL